MSFQAIILAAFHVTFTNGGPLCLGCLHISLPRDCNRIVQCGDHEVCYVEETVSPSGTIWYNSGCMSVTVLVMKCPNKVVIESRRKIQNGRRCRIL